MAEAGVFLDEGEALLRLAAHQVPTSFEVRIVSSGQYRNRAATSLMPPKVDICTYKSLFTRPHHISVDTAHSRAEKRLRAIGRTAAGRYVFIVFTIRERNDGRYIRPISARYMHRKEIDYYENEGPAQEENANLQERQGG